MDTVICQKCGTENPTSAMNCRQCGINLQFAAEHPELFEGTKPEATQPEAGSTKQPVSRGKKVRDLLIGFAAWFAVSSLVAWLAAGVVYPEAGGLLLTPLNIVALICLAFRWRWLALGWLVAYALNLIAALAINQMGSGAACGLPFFMSSW